VNVTEESLRAYVECFHEILATEGQKFFSSQQAQELLHMSLLPATVTAYVSTQFGVAIEYADAAKTSIHAVCGSSRVEDLLVRAPGPLRDVGPCLAIKAADAWIENISLEGAFPFRLKNERASVAFHRVLFSSKRQSWTRQIDHVEVYGDRRAERWSILAASCRAKDEVLAALALAKKAEQRKLGIHEYLSAFREKTVLLLGCYDSAGCRRLAGIADCVRRLGYEPLLVKDIPDVKGYDLLQKVNALCTVSRFVLIDDASPSGHLSEFEVCRANRWLTVILRPEGRGASYTTAGASLLSSVVREQTYDPSDPDAAVRDAVTWAEKKLAELEINLNVQYPWRRDGLGKR